MDGLNQPRGRCLEGSARFLFQPSQPLLPAPARIPSHRQLQGGRDRRFHYKNLVFLLMMIFTQFHQISTL